MNISNETVSSGFYDILFYISIANSNETWLSKLIQSKYNKIEFNIETILLNLYKIMLLFI